MPFIHINNTLSQIHPGHTSDKAYTIATTLNCESSHSRTPVAYLTAALMKHLKMPLKDGVAIISVNIDPETGKLERDENGHFKHRDAWSLESPCMYAPSGFFKVNAHASVQSTIFEVQHQVPNTGKDDLHKLIKVDPIFSIIKHSAWNKISGPVSCFLPRQESTEVKREEPDVKDLVTVTRDEVFYNILEGARNLPFNLKSKYMFKSKIQHKPGFLDTFCEYAMAAALAENMDDVPYPTHLRTKLDLPWGGVTASDPDSTTKYEEDKLQMRGIDIQVMPNQQDKNRKRIITKGHSYDVKAIYSYSRNPDNGIPIEAWHGPCDDGSGPDVPFEYNHKSLWTYSPEHESDIIYVINSTGYVVDKAKLRYMVETRKKSMENCRSSGGPWGDKGYYKWNVHLTLEELEKLASFKLEMPEEFKEHLEYHTDQILGASASFYPYNEDPKLDKSKFRPSIQHFLKHFNPNLPV